MNCLPSVGVYVEMSDPVEVSEMTDRTTGTVTATNHTSVYRADSQR